MRSALRVPYSAPQMASASALINVCTNAVSIDRNRSGSACCSCSSTAGTSIGLRLAVIVVISPSGELGGSTKDHCGDRFHQLRHTDQRQAVHHVPGLLSGLCGLLGGAFRPCVVLGSPNEPLFAVRLGCSPAWFEDRAVAAPCGGL